MDWFTNILIPALSGLSITAVSLGRILQRINQMEAEMKTLAAKANDFAEENEELKLELSKMTNVVEREFGKLRHWISDNYVPQTYLKQVVEQLQRTTTEANQDIKRLIEIVGRLSAGRH